MPTVRENVHDAHHLTLQQKADLRRWAMAEVKDAFEYQLEMLKLEIEVVNATIRQFDDISKNLKEWAITIWAASVGGAIATPALTQYVWATAFIPLLFWLVDTHQHVLQRRFIWRSLVIMDFLNDERLTKSFEQRRLVDFSVMDTGGRRARNAASRSFVSWPRVFLFRTQSILYVGLALASAIVTIATQTTSWTSSPKKAAWIQERPTLLSNDLGRYDLAHWPAPHSRCLFAQQVRAHIASREG